MTPEIEKRLEEIANQYLTSEHCDLKEALVMALHVGQQDSEGNHLEVYKWLLGYYDFPEPPVEGRPRYYWRTHLRSKLKEIGIEIPNPSIDGIPKKSLPTTPKENE